MGVGNSLKCGLTLRLKGKHMERWYIITSTSIICGQTCENEGPLSCSKKHSEEAKCRENFWSWHSQVLTLAHGAPEHSIWRLRSSPICIFHESQKRSRCGLLWAFYVLQNNMKCVIAQSPTFFYSSWTYAFETVRMKDSIGRLKSSIFLKNSLLHKWVMQQARHLSMDTACRGLFLYLFWRITEVSATVLLLESLVFFPAAC